MAQLNKNPTEDKKPLKDRAVFWVLGTLVAAFGVGFFAYEKILEVAHLKVIPEIEYNQLTIKRPDSPVCQSNHLLGGDWLGIILIPADETRTQERERSMDTIQLCYHDGEISGEMQSGKKRWSLAGYLRSDFLVLAYRNTKAESQGIGMYFLRDADGRQTDYVGQWRGRVCGKAQKILECPYVLTKRNEHDAWEKWADYLREDCREVQDVECN